MKIGDKVICIKDYYREGDLIFLSDRFYFVRDIEIYKQHTLIKVDDFYFTIDNISDSQFGIYFQTIADYRDTRINQILSDE